MLVITRRMKPPASSTLRVRHVFLGPPHLFVPIVLLCRVPPTNNSYPPRPCAARQSPLSLRHLLVPPPTHAAVAFLNRHHTPTPLSPPAMDSCGWPRARPTADLEHVCLLPLTRTSRMAPIVLRSRTHRPAPTRRRRFLPPTDDLAPSGRLSHVQARFSKGRDATRRGWSCSDCEPCFHGNDLVGGLCRGMWLLLQMTCGFAS
jgi:hypothetical protein